MMCKTGCGSRRDPGQCFCAPCGDAYDAGPEYREYTERWQGSAEWAERGTKSIEDFCSRLRAERLNGGHSETR
jgi:hypothetical protein